MPAPTPPPTLVRINSSYTPSTWYWVVGNKPGLVFSGAAGDYVPEDDPTYLAWVEGGGQPTAIPVDGALAAVLASHPTATAMAVRHAGWSDWGSVSMARRLQALIRAGVTIQSTATPALDGIYALDTDTRTRIVTNVTYIQEHRAFSPNEATSKVWPDVEGTIHTFTDIQDYLNFSTAVSDYYAGIADWAAADGAGELPNEPVVIA